MEPLVSVILPNYNHAPFLNERIQSILHQTFADFELILLDDHSTDTSIQILESYKNNPKVSHVLFNEINSGSTFSQWAKGLKLARGKYIWIAESDDYAELNFLEKLIPVIEQNQNICMAYCQSHVIAADGKIIGDGTMFYNKDISIRWSNDFVVSGKSEIKNQLIYWNTIPNVSAVLLRKESLVDIPFPVEYKINGDWFLWIQLLTKGDLAYLHDKLNYFRKHHATVRRKEVETGQNIIEYSKIIRYLADNQIVQESEILLAVKRLIMLWNGQKIIKYSANVQVSKNLFLIRKKNITLINLLRIFLNSFYLSIVNRI